MRPGRRLARAVEARVLSRATAAIGVVCGLTAIHPFSETAPRTLAAVLAVAALALSWLLRRLAHLVTVVVVHALLVLVTGVMTICVAGATTPNGAVVTAVTFLWVAIYSAVFHSRAGLVAYLALIGAGLGYGLWASAPPSAVQTWVFVMGTFGGVAWILNGKVVDLREHATRDPLTGALSRRAFVDAAQHEMVQAARTGQPLAVVLVDLDDFKGINDRHGHAAGDAVLAGLLGAWTPHLGPGDVVGRLGGDEFAVLLPRRGEDEAVAVVDRLRDATVDIRFSSGVAQWAGQPLEKWLAAADTGLYEDKALQRRSRSGVDAPGDG